MWVHHCLSYFLLHLSFTYIAEYCIYCIYYTCRITIICNNLFHQGQSQKDSSNRDKSSAEDYSESSEWQCVLWSPCIQWLFKMFCGLLNVSYSCVLYKDQHQDLSLKIQISTHQSNGKCEFFYIPHVLKIL